MGEPPVRVNSSLKVRFINYNERAAQVIWVSCQGQYTIYRVLEPKQFVDVNTFSQHIWIFKEEGTGNRLMANNKPHFCGIDNSYCKAKVDSARYLVYVSKPFVPNLRAVCITQVCRFLSRCTDVKFLEIPVTLKQDIIRKMHFLNPAHLTEE